MTDHMVSICVSHNGHMDYCGGGPVVWCYVSECICQ